MRAPIYVHSSARPLSECYDVLLLDLDGTTYLGKIAAPKAPEGLAEAKARGARAMYLTNNSGRSPEVVASHLTSIGIPTEPHAVLNSSQVAAKKTAELLPEGAKVLLVGGEGLRAAFHGTGFTVVESADDVPAAVIQGLNEAASWADLSEAVLAIHNHGALHIATNMDATIPKERGPMIGNGSFVTCVSHASGSQPINCGKPEPAMFEIGAREAGARAPLAIGDRLDTDIAGAVAAQVPSMHVLTGVSGARDILLAPQDRRPSYLAIDMLDVNMPHPAVTRSESTIPLEADQYRTGVWECGGWTACVTDDHLILDGDDVLAAYPEASRHVDSYVALPLTPRPAKQGKRKQLPSHMTIALDAYRAAACAMWEAADAGMIDPAHCVLPAITVTRLDTYLSADVREKGSSDE